MQSQAIDLKKLEEVIRTYHCHSTIGSRWPIVFHSIVEAKWEDKPNNKIRVTYKTETKDPTIPVFAQNDAFGQNSVFVVDYRSVETIPFKFEGFK